MWVCARVCVCHLIVQNPEILSLFVCVCVCEKKVIRPPEQTALSANNNGYFLLLSLPLSLLSVCAWASWQMDVPRLHLLIGASGCGPVQFNVV